MIALIVIGVLFLLIALILFLPVNVFLKFDNEFYVKVNFAFIKLFETRGIFPAPKSPPTLDIASERPEALKITKLIATKNNT